VTGQGPGFEHGDALDAAVLEEALGHAQLLGEDRGHQANATLISMSTPAGRWSSRWSESTGLGRGLVDVDEPLVGPDLEVLLRVLVLEGRADDGVDVLLRRQRHRTGDRRASARRGLDDLLRRRLDGRRVVGLESDADLVLGCSHGFCLVRPGRWGLCLGRPAPGALEGGPRAGARLHCRISR
jgi:hypothetical protein